METITPLPHAGVGRSIVDKFGGAKKLSALASEHLNVGWAPTTINNWVKTGFVPEFYRPHLVTLAKALGVPHTPFDYVAYLMPFAA